MSNPTRTFRRSARSCLWLAALLAAGSVGACTDSPVADDGDDGEPMPETPPSTPMRHLNRVELANTLQDLLGVAFTGDWVEVGHRLPQDPRVSGFDTIAQSLGTSATYVEQMGGLLEFVVSQIDLTVVAPGTDGTVLPALFDGLGRRALRRPMTPEERVSYTALYDHLATAQGHPVAVRSVIQRLLQSPDFLYQVGLGDPASAGKLTDHEMASRLSYLLWETMPDDALFAAAGRNELHTAAQVEAQLTRMAADPRTVRTLERFQKAWLQVEKLDSIVKDPRLYPEFPMLQASMQESFDRFLADTVATGDLTTLLTSDDAYVDDRLAELYGVASPGAMARVPLPGAQRGGVMTQAGFLAVFGKAERSAPILRGVFVLDRLLCAPPDPPPPNGGVIPTDFPQATTTRDFFTDITAAPGCQGCHEVINPIGFGFEHYDSIGRWRIEERGFPIDATGHATIDGAVASFDGAEQLTDALAGSAQVRRCLVKRWFGSRFGRFDAPADAAIVDALDGAFAAGGSKLRSLATVLAASDAFYRPHFAEVRP